MFFVPVFDFNLRSEQILFMCKDCNFFAPILLSRTLCVCKVILKTNFER